MKTELVKRTSASEQQRLHQLLTAKELGDRKPSQLCRRMQQLLGDHELEPKIMKQLFLQQLPTNAQLILASTKDDLDSENLAKLADKILEVTPTHGRPATLSTVVPTSAPQAPTHSRELQELRELVSHLTTTVNTLSQTFSPKRFNQQPRRRPRSLSRSRLPKRDNDTSQNLVLLQRSGEVLL
mgnify:CR=1 FL=1